MRTCSEHKLLTVPALLWLLMCAQRDELIALQQQKRAVAAHQRAKAAARAAEAAKMVKAEMQQPQQQVQNIRLYVANVSCHSGFKLMLL